MNKCIPTRIHDFANLKKAPDELYLNLHPLRSITASKLFIHHSSDELNSLEDGCDKNIQKTSDTDIFAHNDKRNCEDNKIQRKISSQPNLLTAAENDFFSTLLDNVHSLSTGTLFESHRHSGIYDSDRSWCDLARQADSCVACWNEAWRNIINDLDKSDKLDAKTLEAVYLLRNAHRTGFFHSSSDESNTPSSGDESSRICPPTSTLTNGHHTHADISANMEPVYISRSMSESFSSDERSSSVENFNGMDRQISSGRSTPSFRKKPRRPNIKISDHPIYRDFVEIRRTDSLTSLDSEMDRYSFVSDNSYIDIPYLPETSNGHCGSGSLQNLHELEETLRDDTPIPLNSVDIKYNNLKKICQDRPDSPTSLLLLPIFSSNPDDPMDALHKRLSPLLKKLKTLEEESKLLSSLKSKVATLEHEKEQLTFTLDEQKSDPRCDTSCCDKETITDVSTSTPCDIERLSDILNIINISCADKETLTDIMNSDIETQTSIEYNNNGVQVDSLQSPELFQCIGVQCVPEVKSTGVQRYLELITEVSHVGTVTERISVKSIGVGDNIADLPTCDEFTQCSVDKKEFSCQNNILLSIVDKFTETVKPSLTDKSVGDGIAELTYRSTGIQGTPIQIDSSTQKDVINRDFETMCGSPTSSLINCAVGDKVADIIFNEQSAQTITESKNQSTQSTVEVCDQSISYGCPLNDMKSAFVQHVPTTNDFMCGENKAEVLTCDKASSNVINLKDCNVGTETIEMVNSSVMCNIMNETQSKGVGEDTIDDVICVKCLVPKESVCIGMYRNDDMCSVNDKLCECVKPTTSSVGVGDISIDKINCDKCENLKLVSVGVGDCKTDDLLCDGCIFKKDYSNFASIGVGDEDVNKTTCEKCNSNQDDSNVFNFDLKILSNRPSTPQQQAVLCHYCGNKVDLNDTQLDESLQAMRDNMKSISCGMKRSTATKNLNLEPESPDKNHPSNSASDEDVVVASDDDYEEENTSCRNDVIEACTMLHDHFSGEKPLKQPVMMKYVGIIQSLWFKTVKRRRANASVVKSYLDLFQQRIPELLEMIVNLSDDEGNTALHYALTYKNVGVVSILLDSGECCVDLANQAGYSPIMLAALAGFEKKNDRYIMQRLFRLGDINKESAENGQTPLMLAVSRGNMGIIEILLDAGCDINATDDEGSTALMCACEHGNINIVKILLGHPGCDATIEDNEGSTALSIAMDARRKDLALLVYGSLNFDARGRIKLSPSKQSLLGLGRRSPSPVIGRR